MSDHEVIGKEQFDRIRQVFEDVRFMQTDEGLQSRRKTCFILPPNINNNNNDVGHGPNNKQNNNPGKGLLKGSDKRENEQESVSWSITPKNSGSLGDWDSDSSGVPSLGETEKMILEEMTTQTLKGDLTTAKKPRLSMVRFLDSLTKDSLSRVTKKKTIDKCYGITHYYLTQFEIAQTGRRGIKAW